jgi:hypothetical protein
MTSLLDLKIPAALIIEISSMEINENFTVWENAR